MMKEESKTPYRLMVATDEDARKEIEKLDFILSITNKYADRSQYINELIRKEVANHKELVDKFYQLKRFKQKTSTNST